MYPISIDTDKPFVKTASIASLELLEAEAEGLDEIARCDVIRVPAVIEVGTDGDTAYIALERLHFDHATVEIEQKFGRQLAAMHRHTKDRFGWHRDNSIGPTPQLNAWRDEWVDFLREQRLGYQLELAKSNGYTGELQEKGARLLQELPRWFDGYACEASLLHGDLWAGNWGASDGEPVIFDPAVHYGDRESDLAMTQLFSGFGPPFYEAYEEAWPLEPGHQQRESIYQLYHLLNHLNLFGVSYYGRAIALMDILL